MTDAELRKLAQPEWAPRTCPCGKVFQPRPTCGDKNKAARQKHCSVRCGATFARRTAEGRRATMLAVVAAKGGSFSGRALTELEETPCTRCGLRGHLAGDPDRCIGASQLGHVHLGEWQ